MGKLGRHAMLVCCLGLLTVSTGSVKAEGGGWNSFISRFTSPFQGEPKKTKPPEKPAEQTKPLRNTVGIRAATAQELKQDDRRITPSHVYQATLDLISEIEILREAMGVADFPGEAEPQDDRAPIHVFAKTMEVMKKVSRVQKRLGMIPAQVGQIPVKNIVPKDVLGSVKAIIDELRRVKKQLVIGERIQSASFVGGKTPSLVYKNLGDASFMLDGLVGRPLTPNDVFGNVLGIHDEMELIAAKLKVALQLRPPSVEGRKRPKDVAQQVLRATYKVINLQTRLGMDASGVPNMTLVRVTPAEVFEATNILLAEMVRIKTHLKIELPRTLRGDPRNKKPTDVFAQVLLVIKNLDVLAKAAEKAG